MTVLLMYSLGTLAFWVGAFGLVSCAYRATLKTPLREYALTLAGAFALTVIGLVLTNENTARGAVRLPLAWPVMSFWLWAIAISLTAALLRGTQSLSALSRFEKRSKAGSAATWLLFVALFYAVAVSTERAGLQIVKGSIPLQWPTLAIFAILAVVAALAMVSTARNVHARKLAKGLAIHAALLVGTVVFGLPFAFLVSTSFKEDRDMSSPTGIVWIPKVSETVPYRDPKNPLYETVSEGQTVQGTMIEKLPDGTVRIDVAKPLSIRGTTIVVSPDKIKEIPRDVAIVTALVDGKKAKGKVIEDLEDGSKRVEFVEPAALAGQQRLFPPSEIEPVRNVGLRYQNYSEALSFMPPETKYGLVYLKNTLLLVVFTVFGTLLSSSLVAYAFSRLSFPGREFLFGTLMATLMLPAAVTLLPQFLVFKQLGWIDTLFPLWVPAFFGSAFNVFLLRQFFKGIPMEFEDAAKVDGCTYLRTFWSVLLPQVKPALAVVTIWTFMAAWNNFMGPLIYINTPENMPLSYALQLFQSDRGLGEPGLLMAFATMAMIPVLVLFVFAQKYFIEGVSLSGLGGR